MSGRTAVRAPRADIRRLLLGLPAAGSCSSARSPRDGTRSRPSRHMPDSGTVRRCSYELRPRDRDDEATAATAVLVLLTEYLVTEVPREQQHVVRLLLEERGGVSDRDVHARHQPPLLVHVAVDDE